MLINLVKGRSAESLSSTGQRDIREQTPVAMRDGKWKYYQPPAPAEPMLFDLERDPLESLNLAARHPDILDGMEEQLAMMLARLPEATAGQEIELTEDVREQLRALGYVDQWQPAKKKGTARSPSP